MKKVFMIVSFVLLLFSLYSFPNLNNCVGYWTLNSDDALGTAIYDLSGKGNDGVSANTPVYTNNQVGIVNQAMTFNGTTNKITIGNVGNIKSFSAWVYPTANTKSIADFDGGTISAEIDASNNVTTTAWTSPTIYVNGIASDDITLNAWNYITITSGTNVNASAFVIGQEVSYFTGNISDAMLFSSTLTEDEVRQLYLAGRTTARMKIDATNPHKLIIRGW